MMKFALAAVAVLAVFSPLQAYKLPSVGNGALAKELQPFVDMLPIDQMVGVFLEYAAVDHEFQKMLGYMKSTEFKHLVMDIEADPEGKHLIEYIQTNGLDAHYFVNKLHKYIGLPPYAKTFSAYAIKGGIRGFLDQEEALIPKDKIKDLYYHKLSTSKVFQALMNELKKPEVQKFSDRIVANPHMKSLLAKAKAVGVNVEAVKAFLEKVLGIKFH